MNDVAAIHEEAMSLLDRAQLASRQKDVELSRELTLAALEAERRAAERVRNEYELEPSRSIVLKSVAVIAMRCGLLREAEQWAALALGGSCPHPIADELRAILKRINFLSSLDRDGASLSAGHLRMSLDGPRVGSGLVRYDLLNTRMGATTRALTRAADRKSNVAFRNLQGKAQKPIVAYVGAFVEGSFVVDIMLGTEGRQDDHVSETIASEAVDDIVTCFEYLEQNDTTGLKAHIGDDEYYNNFIGLAREIFPDGESISHVGFAAMTSSGIRSVSVTRKRTEVSISDLLPTTRQRRTITLEGMLRLADSIGGNHEVAIEDPKTKRRVATFLVPVEMMDDIVRPRWGQHVRVTGRGELDKKGQPLKRKKLEFLQFED